MPSVKSSHVNRPLTNFAEGYPQQDFAGPRVLATLPVKKKSDLYYIFDVAREGIGIVDDKREPGAEAREVDFKLTSDSYNTGGHALDHLVTDEERENADAPIKPDLDAVSFLVELLQTNEEVELKVALDAALTGGQTSNPTNEWDDTTSGAPIEDIRLGINTVVGTIGKHPNIMVLDSLLWGYLIDHPDVIDRVKYMGTNDKPGQITTRGVAALFGFEEVIVSSALKNTAVKGQSASLSRIWSDDCYILYRPLRPGIKIPALGYRFVWEPFGGRKGWRVRKWREDKREGDMIRVEKYRDQKITLATAGYRLSDRIS